MRDEAAFPCESFGRCGKHTELHFVSLFFPLSLPWTLFSIYAVVSAPTVVSALVQLCQKLAARHVRALRDIELFL